MLPVAGFCFCIPGQFFLGGVVSLENHVVFQIDTCVQADTCDMANT